jgi:hypothetical protein
MAKVMWLKRCLGQELINSWKPGWKDNKEELGVNYHRKRMLHHGHMMTWRYLFVGIFKLANISKC